MGVTLGVAIGYILGARAGERGWEDLVDAWHVVTGRDEVRDLASGGLSVVRELAGRWRVTRPPTGDRRGAGRALGLRLVG